MLLVVKYEILMCISTDLVGYGFDLNPCQHRVIGKLRSEFMQFITDLDEVYRSKPSNNHRFCHQQICFD